MSEELQQNLRNQLWEVANKLRGNMSASDFMYFTLGFITLFGLPLKVRAMKLAELKKENNQK
jgi:type I restriction enzyme M protein